MVKDPKLSASRRLISHICYLTTSCLTTTHDHISYGENLNHSTDIRNFLGKVYTNIYKSKISLPLVGQIFFFFVRVELFGKELTSKIGISFGICLYNVELEIVFMKTSNEATIKDSMGEVVTSECVWGCFCPCPSSKVTCWRRREC